MRTRPVVMVGVALLVLLAGVPGPVAAEDAPDSCAEAETITATEGTIQGRLGPTDADTHVVEMAKGDFLAATMSRTNTDTYFLFDQQREGRSEYESNYESTTKMEREGSFAEISVTAPEDQGSVDFSEDHDFYQLEPTDREGIALQIYKSGDSGPACLDLRTEGERATAYNITYSLNDADPPELADPKRVAELESRLEERNQRISELKSELDRKDERIAELNATVAELEAESGGTGSATIEVTVAPAGDEQAFVQGSIATVEASGDGIDAERLEATYAGNTYELGEDGEVAIPLAESGTRELQFAYGEATESVTLDVQEQADAEGSPDDGDDAGATDDGSDGASTPGGEDRETSGGVGPGFGAALSALALLLAGLLGRWG